MESEENNNNDNNNNNIDNEDEKIKYDPNKNENKEDETNKISSKNNESEEEKKNIINEEEDDEKEKINEIDTSEKKNIINEEKDDEKIRVNNDNNDNNNIINENEEENINLIKFPYLGKSKNLIDYFLIVGFDSQFKFNNIIKVIESKNIENSNSYSELKLSTKPKILNKIKSNLIEEENLLNENEIINFSFPHQTKVYYQTNHNQKFEARNENIIFSYKKIENNNNNNNIYIGFTYSFYDLLLSKNKFNVYIPKAFIIISFTLSIF